MARHVTCNEYLEIDSQLLEIKLQLRQPFGYPFDLAALRSHLQNGIEGRFAREASSPLLKPIGTIAVPAVKQFSAQKSFVVDTSAEAIVRISYISDRFRTLFGNKIETNVPARMLRYAKLTKASADDAIRHEIGMAYEETKLAHVFALMQLQPKGEYGALLADGRANIYYVYDSNGALRAVDVDWYGGGWRVYADLVALPYVWSAGKRVFSRNSSDIVAV